uniref:Uncharacterized protein n=1 Tax=Physcomitrium patens TaxID=3218 RepID=A0A2K1JPB6_PHYPA|nr:hypothetical protein PHYPA_015770 [Physcomitrium patens]
MKVDKERFMPSLFYKRAGRALRSSHLHVHCSSHSAPYAIMTGSRISVLELSDFYCMSSKRVPLIGSQAVRVSLHGTCYVMLLSC